MPKGVYKRKPRQPKQYPLKVVETVERLYSNGLTQKEVGEWVMGYPAGHTKLKG